MIPTWSKLPFENLNGRGVGVRTGGSLIRTGGSLREVRYYWRGTQGRRGGGPMPFPCTYALSM